MKTKQKRELLLGVLLDFYKTTRKIVCNQILEMMNEMSPWVSRGNAYYSECDISELYRQIEELRDEK